MKKSGRVVYPSLIRIFFLFLIGLLFTAGIILSTLRGDFLIDEIIVLILINIVFYLVFIIAITRKRLKGIIYSGTSYFLFFIAFCLCFVILALGLFLPDFMFPVSVLVIILSSVFDTDLSLALGIYFISFFTIIKPSDALSVYLYIAVITAVFCGYLKESRFRNKIPIGILLLFSNFSLTAFFIYLKEYTLPDSLLYGAIILSVISAIFMTFVYNIFNSYFMKDRHMSYETIIDENYPLITELKRLSNPEYLHAIRVANLSGECADLIGADRKLAMAGGLYYHASNAFPNLDDAGFNRLLNNRCFPPEVMTLILEKGIENFLPTTKESAIVHMCDNLLARFEAIKLAADSSWNTNMMVYQTLNEYSSMGIYDKSKLSMNEFLKIRNLLANKVY